MSWRRRCEAVWAVSLSITVLSRCGLANWLTALLLLLLTPLAYVLRECGEAERAYGDRTAHLQCLAHKELGACAHRHAGGLAHHHHGRRAHGHGTGGFEHDGGGVESGESWCCWIACGAVTGASRSSSLVRSEVASPAFAESLIGCVESKRSQPIANFTDDKTSATSNCRHTTSLHSTATTAIMSDNENGDEMVTKPFKFVTGTPPRAPAQLL